MSPWLPKPPRIGLEPALRDWLTEPDSLTRRLQAASPDFRVRVVREGRMKSPLTRAARPGGMVRGREVVLELAGVPVVFAHSELSTVKGGVLARWLARLGSRSLGSLLFSHPGFVRSPIEYRRLGRHDPLARLARAQGAVGQVWARRSRHRLGGASVWVVEMFFCEICRY